MLRGACALSAVFAIEHLAPPLAWADSQWLVTPARQTGGAVVATGERIFDLVIDDLSLEVNGRTGSAIAVNGSVPGPLILLREGETAVLRVTNRLKEISSIHWHGLILPPEMDGVPGVSFAGIAPGETFIYRIPVRQSGTYWAHSHSGGQELRGLYFPLVIAPREPEPFLYDRD